MTMRVYDIAEARDCMPSIAEEVLENGPVIITSGNSNLIMVSEEDWESIIETLHLMGDPGFDEDVRTGLKTPLSEREAWN